MTTPLPKGTEMSMYLSGGNAHDRRKAARAHLHAAHKLRERAEKASKALSNGWFGTTAVWTPTGLAIGAPADAETIMRAEGVFLKIKAEPNPAEAVLPNRDPLPPTITHVPRCKGTNCDAAIGEPHSKECIAEHAALCAPARDSVQDEAANLRPNFQFIPGASVRNKRTKSVAMMLSENREENTIAVKRGDNRRVWWPVSECENWNV